MKRKFIKAVSLLLCGCLLFGAFGCQGAAGGGDNTASSVGAPNYSESDKKLNMYAFIGPTDGTFTTANGTKVVAEDNRTVERYQEYKDCGFDVLLLLGNDGYNGANRFGDREALSGLEGADREEKLNQLKAAETEAYNKAQLKKNLDMCEQVGLKTIVFDDRVHELSTIEDISLIKADGEQAKPLIVHTQSHRIVAPFEGKGVDFDANTYTDPTTKTVYPIRHIRYQWNSMEELQETLSIWTSPYMSHASFYGMSMFDEPTNKKLTALGEVDKALTALDPDIFVQCCLLPYYGGNSSILSVSSDKAFKEYIQEYLDKTDSEYFGYDYYPMTMNGNTTSMQATYLYCLQMSAELANKNNCDWEIIIQTYAQNNFLREVGYADVDLQVNLALAFGAYNIGYFTYWMWQNKAGWPNYCAIMDDYGNKVIYDEVQKVNNEAKQLAKIILNYRYQKTLLRYNDVSAPVWFKNVLESKLDKVKSFTSNGNTLVNQMYDQTNNCNGYMLVNVGDPAKENVSVNTIEFEGFSCAMVVKNGVTSYKTLNAGKLTCYLEEGESVFVIPYNN